MINKARKMLKFLIPYLKVTGRLIYIILFLLLLLSFLHYIQPLAIEAILDKGMGERNINFLIKNVIILISIIILTQVIEFIQSLCVAKIDCKFSNALYIDVFSKLLSLKYYYFKNRNATEIVNRIQADINNIATITKPSTFMLIKFFLIVISGIVGLLKINSLLGSIVLGILPIKIYLIKKITEQQQKIVKKQLLYEAEFSGWLGDCVNGILEIKLWNLYRVKVNECKEKLNRIFNNKKKQVFINSVNVLIDILLVWGINCVVYCIGGIFVIEEEMTIGEITAFMTYINYVINPFMSLLNFNIIISNIIPSIQRIRELLAYKSELLELEEALKIPSNIELALRNVEFSYGKEKVLRNVNLTIRHGEKIAIIGGNGEGKSTLIYLILQFWEPDSGEILLNKQNIKRYNLDEYRDLFAVVLQNNYLFLDSIYNNICIAKDENFRSFEEVCTLLNMENLDLRKQVGVNGANLSGGERQRIIIARALLKQSKILIFDEITSNQDTKFVSWLPQIISKLSGYTVIFITHRTEHLNLLDRVYVIEDGTLKEKEDLYSIKLYT